MPDKDKPVLDVMIALVTGFRHLYEWAVATLTGEPNAERFLKAANAQALIATEPLASLRFTVFAESARQAVEQLKDTATLEQIADLAKSLQKIPVPILQMQEAPPTFPFGLVSSSRSEQPVESEGPFVIKVMFEIERRPWNTPQLLRSNTIYDFTARVTVPQFPAECDHLDINYVVTLSPEHYRITPLRIDRPRDSPKIEFDEKGRVEFPVAQDLFSEPIDFLVHATFLSASDPRIKIPTTVVGYHHLQVRISDSARTPLLSKYRSIDARNAELIDEINGSMPGLDSRRVHYPLP